jgi:hypothetical protein
MHKVVFNNCYGGFSISLKAVDWLEANCKDNELRKFIKVTRNKTLLSLSNDILCYDISEYFEDNRHHKDLVAVVEALGDEANGPCASLEIRKIDGNQYRIDEYDGAEEVIVPDCENWIFIND